MPGIKPFYKGIKDPSPMAVKSLENAARTMSQQTKAHKSTTVSSGGKKSAGAGIFTAVAAGLAVAAAVPTGGLSLGVGMALTAGQAGMIAGGAALGAYYMQ